MIRVIVVLPLSFLPYAGKRLRRCPNFRRRGMTRMCGRFDKVSIQNFGPRYKGRVKIARQAATLNPLQSSWDWASGD